MSKKDLSKNRYEEKFVYCDARNCPYKQCLRAITHAPFDELIRVVRYEIDKNGKCKGLLEG